MKSYAKWYRIYMIENCHVKEKEIIKAFRKSFTLAEGNEYFRVPLFVCDVHFFEIALSMNHKILILIEMETLLQNRGYFVSQKVKGKIYLGYGKRSGHVKYTKTTWKDDSGNMVKVKDYEDKQLLRAVINGKVYFGSDALENI
ncbi:hypothetical protein PMV_057 [Port-miou virus]|uniref:Uncharacterized protein n=1 Tax=Port-miou virus TaxID=1733873 RepID=A0A0N9PYS5_9VIRU|nr:hypothetical protein PMV_057 [Port-miou virus]